MRRTMAWGGSGLLVHPRIWGADWSSFPAKWLVGLQSLHPHHFVQTSHGLTAWPNLCLFLLSFESQRQVLGVRGRWQKCKSIKHVRTAELRTARVLAVRGPAQQWRAWASEGGGPGRGKGRCHPAPTSSLNGFEFYLPLPWLENHKTGVGLCLPRGTKAALWFAALREIRPLAAKGWFLLVTAVNLNFREPKLAPFVLCSIHHWITALNASVALSGASWIPSGGPSSLLLITVVLTALLMTTVITGIGISFFQFTMSPEISGSGRGGHSWSRGRCVLFRPEQGKAARAEVPPGESKGDRSQAQHSASHAVLAPFLSAGIFSLPPTPYPQAPLSLFQKDVFILKWCIFHTRLRDEGLDWRFGFPCALPLFSPHHGGT